MATVLVCIWQAWNLFWIILSTSLLLVSSFARRFCWERTGISVRIWPSNNRHFVGCIQHFTVYVTRFCTISKLLNMQWKLCTSWVSYYYLEEFLQFNLHVWGCGMLYSTSSLLLYKWSSKLKSWTCNMFIILLFHHYMRRQLSPLLAHADWYIVDLP